MPKYDDGRTFSIKRCGPASYASGFWLCLVSA
jgi:hypothetical protein